MNITALLGLGGPTRLSSATTFRLVLRPLHHLRPPPLLLGSSPLRFVSFGSHRCGFFLLAKTTALRASGLFLLIDAALLVLSLTGGTLLGSAGFFGL